MPDEGIKITLQFRGPGPGRISLSDHTVAGAHPRQCAPRAFSGWESQSSSLVGRSAKGVLDPHASVVLAVTQVL